MRLGFFALVLYVCILHCFRSVMSYYSANIWSWVYCWLHVNS